MEWHEFGLDGFDALRVVISCVVFYFGIIVVVRLFGQRALASLSSFDLAAIIALGAVVGRAILGNTPTLVAGVLAVGTLLVLQAVTGQARRSARIEGIVNSPAIVLMAGEEFLTDNMARAHVDRVEVISKLRMAGIRQLSEVACVILEPTGQISVTKRGRPIDPVLLHGVVGAERIPRDDVG